MTDLHHQVVMILLGIRKFEFLKKKLVPNMGRHYSVHPSNGRIISINEDDFLFIML